MRPADIRAVRPEDAKAVQSAVDQVAREERWLGAARAHSVEETEAFIRARLEGGEPHIVAIDPDDATRIVGWCDVARYPAESRRHCGRLGMGLVPGWRGQGLGRRLIDAALAVADALPLDRVELDVLTDNAAAIALYQRVGFVREGLRPGAWRLGDVTRDMIAMGRRNPHLGGDDRTGGA